ncbi:hypothetical protein HYE68_010034 [Fusarium pseudograminearum]|nr:hypothetical protein HYE68_010034 [Fusarium pseudograminearum]
MCKFMELEFSCSTTDNPHRLETQGLLPCDNFQSCVFELVNFKRPKSDIAQKTQVLVQHYMLVKIDGDCQKCAERKTKLIQNRERISQALMKESENMDKIPGGSMKGGSGKVGNLRQIHQDRADHQPDTICASGPCKRLAMVSTDGRRGMFCKTHTCSAREWNCLLDTSTTQDGVEFSVYCTAHTCDTLGCNRRIADLSTVHCTKHRR